MFFVGFEKLSDGCDTLNKNKTNYDKEYEKSRVHTQLA